MGKYTLKFKLQVVNYYLSGQGGQKKTARKFGITKNDVQIWLAIYEKHGKDGLEMKRRRYNGEFKCSVVEYMYQHQLSARATGAHFGILFCNVTSWDKIYQQQGRQVLLNKRHRQTPKMDNSKKLKNISQPDDQKTTEELLVEIQYLRAEVAYLKKLEALTQEKKKLARKKNR